MTKENSKKGNSFDRCVVKLFPVTFLKIPEFAGLLLTVYLFITALFSVALTSAIPSLEEPMVFGLLILLGLCCSYAGIAYAYAENLALSRFKAIRIAAVPAVLFASSYYTLNATQHSTEFSTTLVSISFLSLVCTGIIHQIILGMFNLAQKSILKKNVMA